MSDAVISAHFPIFLFKTKITVAAAKEDIVCPDGNEKSVGQGNNSLTSGWKKHGRILETSGFKITLPAITHSTNAKITMIPVVLFFLEIINNMAVTIQTAPPLPIHEKASIILSNIKK